MESQLFQSVISCRVNLYQHRLRKGLIDSRIILFHHSDAYRKSKISPISHIKYIGHMKWIDSCPKIRHWGWLVRDEITPCSSSTSGIRLRKNNGYKCCDKFNVIESKEPRQKSRIYCKISGP